MNNETIKLRLQAPKRARKQGYPASCFLLLSRVMRYTTSNVTSLRNVVFWKSCVLCPTEPTRAPYIENLRTLNLKSNNITELGAKSIAESPKLANLEHLILKFNRVGELGATYLAESETLTNLSTLDLFRNRIGDKGAQIIKKSKNFRGLSRMRLD